MVTTTERPPVRKPRTVKPVSGICRLTLTINDVLYAVEVLQPHPEVASVAYRLHKPDGTLYDVAQTEHGAECSCPDFLYSRDGKDPEGCKHVASLRALRLLPAIPELVTPARKQADRSTGDLAANDPDAYAEQFGPCGEPEPWDWADYPEPVPMTPEEMDAMARECGQD